MGSEWREVRLSQLADEITVGHVGPMPAYVEDGIPFLRSQNVDRLRINEAGVKSIDSASHGRLRKSALHPGDVVIVRTGRPGACAVIPPSLPVANCSDLVIVRCGRELDPWFLAYYINSAALHGVSSQVVGAVQQHFNIGSARDLTIRLPDLATQREVVEILRALDDKIELNRRMSETLESMARAIFRYWFIDFDPMRVGSFGEVAEIVRDPQDPAGLPEVFFDHYSLPAFDAGQRPVVELGAAIKSLKFRIPEGAVLMSKLNPDIDRVWLVDLERKRPSIGSTEFLVLRPRPPYGRCYLYCLARSEGFRRDLQALATGTSNSHQRAQWDGVLGIQVPEPPTRLAQEFERTVKPILDQRTGATRQSLALSKLRDSLLPRLLSGSKLPLKEMRWTGQ